MFPTRRWLLTLVAVLPACATNAARQEADRAADHLARHPTLLMTPVTAPPDLDLAPELLAFFDSALARRFERAGLHVLPVGVYLAEWDSALGGYGGLRMAETGEVPTYRYERARQHLEQRLSRAYDDPVLVFPEFERVTATYEGSRASWDGKSQRIPGTGNWLSDVGEALWLGLLAVLADEEDAGERTVPTGIIPALSLGVYLETVTGALVYSRRVGVQVLARWDEGTFVPQDVVVLDDGAMRDATMDDLLDPIIEATHQELASGP